MQIQYHNSPYFTSHFSNSKAFKEVKDLARQTGRIAELRIALDNIKYIKNYEFNLVHKYNKSQDVCKSEFKYLLNGQKQVYSAIENRLKDPVEASLKWILALGDKTSKIYQNILG